MAALGDCCHMNFHAGKLCTAIIAVGPKTALGSEFTRLYGLGYDKKRGDINIQPLALSIVKALKQPPELRKEFMNELNELKELYQKIPGLD